MIFDKVLNAFGLMRKDFSPADLTEAARTKITQPSNSWMGAGQPIAPAAQDAVHGRQFDYPIAINTRIGTKNDTGATQFSDLRTFADSLDILRLVIETRKDQVEMFEWAFVPKKGMTSTEEELKKVTALFNNPTPEYNWSAWVRMILEEIFVIDAVAVLPRMTRGGDLYSLDLLDGATLSRKIDDSGRTPIPPDPAYQQIIKGVPAADYHSDELIYSVRNPRVSKIYGFSPVEQIMMTANIALRRQTTQLQYYTEGNIPEALAGVPDSWNPDQVAQFQLYFDSIMQGNSAARSRLKFVPLDPSKFRETKDANLKDQFDEWLAKVVCYAFSVPATPFVSQVNRATAETVQQAAMQEGLQPILLHLKRFIDGIVSKYMNLPNVEFTWTLPNATSPLIQAQIDQIYIAAGVRSAKEVSEERGYAPVEAVQEVQQNEPV